MTVRSLLNFDLANGTTAISDEVDAVAWTRTAGATVGEVRTAEFRSGTASLYTESDTEYHRSFSAGVIPGDFTVEGWFKPGAGATGTVTMFEVTCVGTNRYASFAYDMTNDTIESYNPSAGVRTVLTSVSESRQINPNSLPSVGGWVHIAFCRRGAETLLFVNSILQSSGVTPYIPDGDLIEVRIGGRINSGGLGDGPLYSDAFRVTDEVLYVSGVFNSIQEPPTTTPVVHDYSGSITPDESFPLLTTVLFSFSNPVVFANSELVYPITGTWGTGIEGGGGSGPPPPMQYWG